MFKTEFFFSRGHFHCFTVYSYANFYLYAFPSYVCKVYLSNERNFSTVLYPRDHVYKFKFTCDKRINIDADEAKSRNTVTGQAHNRSKTFPGVTLIPI